MTMRGRRTETETTRGNGRGSRRDGAPGRAAPAARRRGKSRPAAAPQARGREAVRAALLTAATELFADRGPARVSVRDIAARAGVNHGLVHRHFGSKDAVLRAVLDHQWETLLRPVDAAPEDLELLAWLWQPEAVPEAGWRIMARALLDGYAARDLRRNFAVMQRLVAAGRRQQESGRMAAEFDPRIVAAGGVAMVLGWLVFEPFLIAATGMDDRSLADVRREFTAARQRIRDALRGSAAPPGELGATAVEERT